MLSVKFVAGAGVEHVRFDGRGVASWAIHLTSVKASRFVDIAVQHVATGGLWLDTETGPGAAFWQGSKGNHFEQIWVDLVSPPNGTGTGLVGILMTGNPCPSVRTDWHNNTFLNGNIKLGTRFNHTGLDLKFADSNTFYEFDFQDDAPPEPAADTPRCDKRSRPPSPPLGAGILLDSIDNDFPLNNGFYNCSIGGGLRVQNNAYRVGKNVFLPFPTKDREGFPPPPAIGITDEMMMLGSSVVLPTYASRPPAEHCNDDSRGGIAANDGTGKLYVCTIAGWIEK